MRAYDYQLPCVRHYIKCFMKTSNYYNALKGVSFYYLHLAEGKRIKWKT